MSVVKLVSLFLQFGGKWQLDAVALLREILLNRSLDVDVRVGRLRRGAFWTLEAANELCLFCPCVLGASIRAQSCSLRGAFHRCNEPQHYPELS